MFTSSRWRITVRALVPMSILVSLLAGVTTQGIAATPTIQGAAYGHLKNLMSQYDKAGFSRVVRIGNKATYRTTLSSINVKVDTSLKPLAVYDPNTKTITFSKDPRKVTASESLAFGETCWHELTHAIEDAHGDIGLFDNAAYAERNIDYMTHVARVPLPILQKMEKDALRGVSAAKLEARWRSFVRQIAAASTLPSNREYPPN